MLTRLAILLLALLSANSALAQLGRPAGWTIQQSNAKGIVFASPKDQSGHWVRIVIPPPLSYGPDFAVWHKDRASLAIAGIGGRINESGTTPQPGGSAVVHWYKVIDASNQRQTIYIDAHKAQNGIGQIVMTVHPHEIPANDPRVRQADDFVKGLRISNYAVSDADIAFNAALLANEGKSPPAQTAPPPSGAPPSPSPVVAAPPTAPPASPGAVGHAAVETVLFHTRRFINNRIIPSTTLLLKNGTAYLEEAKSPLDFKSGGRPHGSSGVGSWQLTGDGYRITWSDGATEKTVNDTGKTKAGAADQRFSGRFEVNMASDNLPWADVAIFRPDGTFTVHQSGTNKVMGTGTYKVDGWTAEIAYAGQPPKRWLFGLQGNPQQPDIVVIGDVIFGRK